MILAPRSASGRLCDFQITVSDEATQVLDKSCFMPESPQLSHGSEGKGQHKDATGKGFNTVTVTWTFVGSTTSKPDVVYHVVYTACSKRWT